MHTQAPLKLWQLWLTLGVALVLGDLGNSILLTGSLGGALQQRAVVPQDFVLGLCASLAMSASQIWLFSSLHAGRSLVRDPVVMLLVIPGVLLNVAANFIVLTGGRPAPELIANLERVLATGAQSPVGKTFLLVALLLALLISFLPEFLLARAWHERAAR